jgi:hypothetical protein
MVTCTKITSYLLLLEKIQIETKIIFTYFEVDYGWIFYTISQITHFNVNNLR